MRARGCSEPPFGGIERCSGNATEVQGCKTSDCTGNIFCGKRRKCDLITHKKIYCLLLMPQEAGLLGRNGVSAPPPVGPDSD